MIEQVTETTYCKACGEPLVQAVRRGPHPREYCNDTCRQRAKRARDKQKERRQQQAAMRERWGEYPPEVQQVLEDVMQLHSVGLAEQVASAINVAYGAQATETRIAELEKRVHELQARLNFEEGLHTDTQVRHFKQWLRRRPQPRDSDFAKRFLTDNQLPQRASRALYEAKLRANDYTTEDIHLFRDLWLTMILEQSS